MIQDGKNIQVPIQESCAIAKMTARCALKAKPQIHHTGRYEDNSIQVITIHQPVHFVSVKIYQLRRNRTMNHIGLLTSGDQLPRLYRPTLQSGLSRLVIIKSANGGCKCSVFPRFYHTGNFYHIFS